MAEQRLPTVNGDDGQWGTILNQFLTKEHYNTGSDNAANGGHKNITIQASNGGAGTAPIKFAAGTLLGTMEAGALEFNSDKLFMTNAAATVRDTVATYDDSAGAAGDLYYRTAGGDFVRLPIGTSLQVLRVVSGLPTWATMSAGTTRSVSTVSTNTSAGSAASTDYLYFVTGTTTITLPTAVSNTNEYEINNTGTNTVTVNTTGGQTINGSSSATLPIPNMSLTFVSDGANWYVQ